MAKKSNKRDRTLDIKVDKDAVLHLSEKDYAVSIERIEMSINESQKVFDSVIDLADAYSALKAISATAAEGARSLSEYGKLYAKVYAKEKGISEQEE